jgi:hypothetical protein
VGITLVEAVAVTKTMLVADRWRLVEQVAADQVVTD